MYFNSGGSRLREGENISKILAKYMQNQTNVQLCSSQVDKGKSNNLSENFLVEIFLGENFFELKFFG